MTMWHLDNYYSIILNQIIQVIFVANQYMVSGDYPPWRPACHLDTQDTVFDSLDTQNFRAEFADDDNFRR